MSANWNLSNERKWAKENALSAGPLHDLQADLAFSLGSGQEWLNYSGSVIGFMLHEGTNQMYVAYSGPSASALQTQQIQARLKSLELGKNSKFIGHIDIDHKFLVAAENYEQHSGCAEKKLMSFAIANKLVIRRKSMAAFRILRYGEHVFAEHIEPCSSCYACIHVVRAKLFGVPKKTAS